MRNLLTIFISVIIYVLIVLGVYQLTKMGMTNELEFKQYAPIIVRGVSVVVGFFVFIIDIAIIKSRKSYYYDGDEFDE